MCYFSVRETQEKSVGSSLTIDLPKVEGVFTNKDTQPGDKVFCEQYMPSTKSCLIRTRVKSPL